MKDYREVYRSLRVKTMVLFITLTCMASTSVRAQVSNLFFALDDSQFDYLHYNRIRQRFDSAMVDVTVGEFRIEHNTKIDWLTWSPLPEEDFESEWRGVGDDYWISSHCRTRNFIVPSGEVFLSFYRELAAHPFVYPETIPNLPKTIDRYWYVGKGLIRGESEFRIQVVRARDNTVLCTIDSVGVFVNPSSDFASRYGTEPNRMNHRVKLSKSLSGDTVYMRLVPHRSAVSSARLSCTQFSTPHNLSATREYSDSSLSTVTTQEYEVALERFKIRAKQYADSLNSTGKPQPLRFKREEWGRESK